MPSTTWAPTAPRSAASSVRTAPRVPTGMNVGVRNAPRAVCTVAARAPPSTASIVSRSGAAHRRVSAAAFEQHGVAEGQEAVAAGERLLVQLPPAGADEGVDQHQQRGPGDVEVGEQPVDDAELEAAPDEQVRAPGDAAGRGPRLERPHHGGAHGQHPTRGPPRPDGVSASRVSGGIRYASVCMAWSSTRSLEIGPERAQTHHQLQAGEADPPGGQPPEQRLGQVQPGRRRRGRRRPAGVDGLVALRVVDAAGQVGREGHIAMALQEGDDGLFAGRTAAEAPAEPPAPLPQVRLGHRRGRRRRRCSARRPGAPGGWAAAAPPSGRRPWRRRPAPARAPRWRRRSA